MLSASDDWASLTIVERRLNGTRFWKAHYGDGCHFGVSISTTGVGFFWGISRELGGINTFFENPASLNHFLNHYKVTHLEPQSK